MDRWGDNGKSLYICLDDEMKYKNHQNENALEKEKSNADND